MTRAPLKAQIAREIYIAMERLGAGPELLSIIGSWCDHCRTRKFLRSCECTTLWRLCAGCRSRIVENHGYR